MTDGTEYLVYEVVGTDWLPRAIFRGPDAKENAESKAAEFGQWAYDWELSTGDAYPDAIVFKVGVNP